MDSFLFSLNAIVPVFAVMIIGYLLKRLGWIDDNFANTANKFVFKICLPALLFQDLMSADIRHHFDVTYVLYCAGVTVISIAVIWMVSRHVLKDKNMVGAFVQASYRSSAAILGTAFIQNIYGNSGMAPLMIIGAVPIYNIAAVIILTLEGEHSGQGKEKIKRAVINILKNPIIIGIVAGCIASLLGLDFPQMVDKTISSLAVMTSPLALISIGAGFEGRKALAKMKPTCVASFIKLLGLSAVFLPVAIELGFRDQKLMALIIMLGSPTTPTAYIMAKNMGGDDVLSSSVVVMTTFLSAITLTFWIFLMRYFGWL